MRTLWENPEEGDIQVVDPMEETDMGSDQISDPSE